MIQAGNPPKMLQEIMGQASITTTLDLYGHLYPGDMDRYADRLDSAADEARKAKISPDGPGRAEQLILAIGAGQRLAQDRMRSMPVRARVKVT
jgi:hypothetical protein